MTEGGKPVPHAIIPKKTRENARKMRKEPTEAERRFWNAVRAHRLEGMGFRRQLPIAGYIVDYACASHMIIVELDGSQHADNQDYDAIRSARLEADGWTILRFWNDDILHDLDNACRHILKTAGVMTP